MALTSDGEKLEVAQVLGRRTDHTQIKEQRKFNEDSIDELVSGAAQNKQEILLTYRYSEIQHTIILTEFNYQ